MLAEKRGVDPEPHWPDRIYDRIFLLADRASKVLSFRSGNRQVRAAGYEILSQVRDGIWVSRALEWDEAKRLGNIEKHEIDFVEAAEIFDHPHLTFSSRRGGEDRQISLGRVGTRLVALIWTDRNGTIRLISARAARRNERRIYQARFGA